MELILSDQAKQDLNFWKTSGQAIVKKKIENLFKSIEQTPFAGIGKPEALKHELSGYWSRKIDRKNRIVYSVDEENEQIFIVSCLGHYQ